jgi:Leucine-rich repeat (LRR) protein
MIEVRIKCKGLSKAQIDTKIEKKTRGLTDIRLIIRDYEHESLVGIMFPLNMIGDSTLTYFVCSYSDITSFEGLVLPVSTRYFWCSYSQITSFTGLVLSPDIKSSLKEFYCYENRISSFTNLKLPDSLEIFNCSHNQITSFTGLILPKSLTHFSCSHNQITSFTDLKLDPPLLESFDCYNNHITIIEDFVFPSHLIYLTLLSEIKFINPKFNSVLRIKLENRVEFSKLDRSELIFLYLNFNMSCNEYDQILTSLSSYEILMFN